MRGGVNMERSKPVQKKKSLCPITTCSKYNNNEYNMVLFYKIWKKYNEIQLTKNNNKLEQSKI